VTHTTLAPDHTPVERCASKRDEMLGDVFTTALEGGIGYWSACSRYKWSVDGTLEGQARDFIAVVEDTEDDHGTQYVIDRACITRGLRLAHERGNWADYHARALRDLTFGNWDDLDFDADTADIIVQFGLFGEQRYA
jgi:hypothetical protein